MKKWFKTSSIAILVSIFLPMLAFSAAGDFTPQRDGITLSHNNGLGTGSSVEFNRFTDDTFYAQQKGHIPGELAHQEALAFAVQNGLQDHLDQRDFLSIRTSGAGLSNRYLHGVDDLKQGDRILVNVYVNNNATQACGGVNPSLSTRAQIDWGGEDGKILGAILSSNASPTQINDKVDVSGTGGLDFRYLSAVVIERENPDGSPDGSACGSRNTRFQARNVTATVQGDTAQVDLGSVGGGYGHAKFVVFELEVVANNARPLRVSRNISIAASTLKNNAIVSAGTEFSYNVKVENVSGETINNVVVTDTLDSHLEFVVGTGGVSHNGNTITLQYGNIAAQSSATLNYTVRVKAATANGITFCTQGVATADTPGGLSVTENCPFCTSVQDLSLSFINTIHVCGNGLSEFGRVADQSGLGFKINGNEECDDGNLQDGDQCNSYCRSDSLNDGLVVTLEAIPSSGTTLERGDTIDYILTVTNNFQRDVTGIIIGNPLPNGVTYVGAIDPTTPGIIVHANGTVTVNVGDLVPGESKAFRYQVRIDGDAPFGPIVNRATVNAAHVLDNNGNSVDLSGLQSNPVIHFVVQDATPVCGNHRREAGEQCDDGNTASNDGCSSTCQVENPQNCGIDGNGDGNLVDPGEECDDGGTVSGDGCNNLCQLEGGICGNGVTEQISCPAGLVCATVLIVEQCDDGNLIDGDGCSAMCEREDQGLFIQKQSMPNSGATVGRGDTITYTITAKNELTVNLSGVILTDVLNANLEFGSVVNADGGTITHSGNVVTMDSGNFTPNQEKRFIFTVTVKNNATLGPITNTVSGVGTPTGGAPISGVSNPVVHHIVDVVNPICGNGRLEGTEQCDDGNLENGDGCSDMCVREEDQGLFIQKEALPNSGATVGRGDTITYMITARNNLEVNMNSVVLTDTLNTNLQFGSVISNGGGTITHSGGVVRIQSGNFTPHQEKRFEFTVTVKNNANLGRITNVVVGVGTPVGGEPIVGVSNPVIHFIIPVVNPVCGNSRLEGDEQCDDGNTVPGDGCDSQCQIEGIVNPICGQDADGDGDFLDPYEQCDDGNLTDGDGCSAVCTIEVSPFFDAIKTANPVDRSMVSPGDQIDYTIRLTNISNRIINNVVLRDVIDPRLDIIGDISALVLPAGMTLTQSGQTFVLNIGTLPAGATLNFTFSTRVVAGATGVINNQFTVMGDPAGGTPGAAIGVSNPVFHPLNDGGSVCGNNTVESGEECDDGNMISGDGCNQFCQEEFDCGNGTVEMGEQCDDGNLVSGDGCSAVCVIETSAFFAAVKSASPAAGTMVNPGDQIDYTIQLTNISGQTVSNVQLQDVIDSRLSIVGNINDIVLPPGVTLTRNGQVFTLNVGTMPAGASLNFTFQTQVIPTAFGNISNQFTVRGDPAGGVPGSAIGFSNAVFHPVQDNTPECGNTIVEEGEECDDGNLIDGDGCNQFCQDEFDCGNGTREGNEQCDDGNLINGDGCSATCTNENPGLEVTLIAIPASGATVGRGQNIDYIVEVRNTGMLPLSGVVATASLDSRYTFVGEQAFGTQGVTGKVSHAAGVVTINVGALGAGQAQIFKYRIVVKDDAPLGGPVSHRVEARGTPSTSTVQVSDTSNQVVHFIGSVVNPQCGNGRTEGDEECDDGNTTSGDGCSATCMIEAVVGVCGDGNLATNEQCDDGNTTSGDGCSATCTIEPNNFFQLIKTSTPTSGQSVMPGSTITYNLRATNISTQVVNNVLIVDTLDSKVELVSGSVIAPANATVTINGQTIRFALASLNPGLSVDFAFQVQVRVNASGTVSNSFAASGLPAGGGGPVSAVSPPVFNPIGSGNGSCGDNTVDPGEECDDGNQIDGDGCSRLCQIEGGECGNGTREGSEQCDDGNLINGDGCSMTCQLEDNNFDLTKSASPAPGDVAPGDEITYTLSVKNVRLEAVQNITVTDTLDSRVEFDRWVTFPGDTRDVTNQVVTIGINTLDPQQELIYSFVVKVRADARGNITNTFSATGTPVGGTTGGATGSSNPVTHTVPELCGNAIIDTGEACDDGKHCQDGTSCTADSQCTGNGDGQCIVRAGIGADPTCSSSCQIIRCGNGVIDDGEQCDDGNTISGDGCSAICQTETDGGGGGGGGGGGSGPSLPSIGTCQVQFGAAQCVARAPQRFNDPNFDIYGDCLDNGLPISQCLLLWADAKGYRVCGETTGVSGEIEIPMQRGLTLSDPIVREQCGLSIPAGGGGPGRTSTPNSCLHCPQCFAGAKLEKFIEKGVNVPVKDMKVARGDMVDYRLSLTLTPDNLGAKEITNIKVIFRDVSIPADSTSRSNNRWVLDQRYGLSTDIPGVNYHFRAGTTHSGLDASQTQADGTGYVSANYHDPNGSYYFDPIQISSGQLLTDLNSGAPVVIDFGYSMQTDLDELRDLDIITNVAIASVIYDYREVIGQDAFGADIVDEGFIPVIIDNGRDTNTFGPTANVYDNGNSDFCGAFTDFQNHIAANSNSARVEIIRPFIEAKAGGDMGFALNNTDQRISSSKEDITQTTNTNTAGRVHIPTGGDQTRFDFGPDSALIRNDMDTLDDLGYDTPEAYLDHLGTSLGAPAAAGFIGGVPLQRVGGTQMYWFEPTAATPNLFVAGAQSPGARDYDMGGKSKTIIINNGDLVIGGNFRVNNGFLAFIVRNGKVIIDTEVEYMEGLVINRSPDPIFDGFPVDNAGVVDTTRLIMSKAKLNVSGAFVGDIYPLLAKRNYIGEDPDNKLEANAEFLFDIRMIDQTPPGLEHFLGEGWKQVAQ